MSNRQDKGEARYDFKITLPDGIVRPRQTSKAHSAEAKNCSGGSGETGRHSEEVRVVGYRSERNKKYYDLKAMIGGSSSTDIKEALGAKKRSDFDEKRKRRWLRRSTRWTSSLPIRTIYRIVEV
jgi:hypothetical protein